MALTSVLSLLVLVVSAGGSVGPSSNSSLCSESRECLQYELLCKTDEYEVRHYSPTLWVSTDAEAYFMGVGAAVAFRRLFQYITGANEGGYQMDMTAPVLVKIPEETRMWEPAIYTLSFPLPQAYQEIPPQPTHDKLYFTEMPDMDVYVRSYGGWMLSVTSRLQAHQLTKELDRVGASYNHTHHYGVGYDSPLKLLNRHNEVWYVSEGKPVCTDPQEPTPPHPSKRQADDLVSEAPHSSMLQADDTASEAPHSSMLQTNEPASSAPSALDLGAPSVALTSIPTSAPSSPSSGLPDAPPTNVDNTTSSNSSQTTSITVSLSQATPKPSQESTAIPSEESTPTPSEESTLTNSSASDKITPSTSEQSTQSTSILSTDSALSQASPSAHIPLELTPDPSDPSLGVSQSEHPLSTAPEHQEPHSDAQ